MLLNLVTTPRKKSSIRKMIAKKLPLTTVVLLTWSSTAFLMTHPGGPRVLTTRRLAQEYETVEVTASSAVPLEGTWYRTGPVDGNGVMAAVTFDGTERALARVRYVRTRNYRAQQQTNEKFRRKLERTGADAVSCVYWGDRLYTLQTQGNPLQMDPLSLGTQKSSDLGGQIEDRFSPSPRLTQDTLVNIDFTPENLFFPPQLAFHEYDARFFRTNFDKTVKLQLDKGERLIDWAVTKSKYLASTSKGLHIADRITGDDDLRIIESKDLIGGSIINCYDDGDDIVVDGITTGDLLRRWIFPRGGGGGGGPRVVDSNVYLTAGTVAVPQSIPHDVIYGVKDNQLLKISTENFGKTTTKWTHPEANAKVSLPTILDDKVIAMITYGDTTEAKVFDSSLLTPETTIPLPKAIAFSPDRFDGPFVKITPTLEELKSSEVLTRLYAKKSQEWNEIDGGFSGLGIKSFLFPKGVSGG